MRGELDWIVMKALEKDRNRRYETANGLAADLRRYLDDEPVQACPPSVRYRLSKLARKHRAALATTVAFALLLLLGAAVSTWQAVVATRAKRAAIKAEATTRQERDRAIKAEGQATASANQAQTEAAIATAVNDFLQNDLLAEAAPKNNARDRQVTVEAVLNKAAARIAGKFDGNPEVEAAIRQTVGDTYWELGLYPEGQPHLERALELRRRVLGPEHPDTLMSMNNLAELYWDRGEYEKAEPLLTQALEVKRRVLGPEHPDTLTSMNNLAVAVQGSGPVREGRAAVHAGAGGPAPGARPGASRHPDIDDPSGEPVHGSGPVREGRAAVHTCTGCRAPGARRGTSRHPDIDEPSERTCTWLGAGTTRPSPCSHMYWRSTAGCSARNIPTP